MTTPHPPNGIMRFDVGAAPTVNDGIPFEVAGLRPDGTAWSEVFVAMPEAPAWAFQHLLNSIQTDPQSGAVGQFAPDVIKYLRACLIDQSARSRWDRMLADPERVVTTAHLFRIMQWLTGRQGHGFPTGAPSASSVGASPSGRSSQAERSGPGSLTWDRSQMAPAAVYGQDWTPSGATPQPSPGGPPAGSSLTPG